MDQEKQSKAHHAKRNRRCVTKELMNITAKQQRGRKTKRLYQKQKVSNRVYGLLVCIVFTFSMIASVAGEASGTYSCENALLVTDNEESFEVPSNGEQECNKERQVMDVLQAEVLETELKLEMDQKDTKKVQTANHLEYEVVLEETAVEELDWEKLEEMKEDPWTPTLDFLPYLQGDFETNVMLMAKVIFVESRGASDEEQQLQGLVLLARSFHPYSFSDGTGNLESAIFKEEQYPWAADGIDDIVPDEQSINNAKAVLTGKVLDTENISGITRNVEYANTSPLGYETYCKVWNEPMGVWVYFDYGL